MVLLTKWTDGLHVPAGYRGREARPQPRRGVVLLAVLIVVVLMTLAAYQYSELMMAERRTAESYARSAQSRAVAESGVYYTAILLSNPDSFNNRLGGNPYHNEEMFANIVVPSTNPLRRPARFSVVAPYSADESMDASRPYRYGVIDEAGKIDLNALMKLDGSGEVAFNVLMKLPDMTEDVANSIIMWMDPRNRPRSDGADNAHYSALPQPYRLKSGPLDSPEELLLVRGVTAPLLYGNDRNRNGIRDLDEEDDLNGVNSGWSAYLTVYNRERNLDSTGLPRAYINDNDLATLNTKLLEAGVDAEVIDYIRAYRLYGPAQTQSSGSGQSATVNLTQGSGGTMTLVLTLAGRSASSSSPDDIRFGPEQLARDLQNTRSRPARRISSLYELIDSQVPITISVQGPNGQPTSRVVNLPSPLSDRAKLQVLLPVLLDKASTVQGQDMPARVNINTAPRAVLEALPGLEPDDVQSILDNRPDPTSQELPDAIFKTPAWLITHANFEPAQLVTLDRYITTQSQVYRAQVMGYLDGVGPTVRVEAVIHTNGGRPRIVYFRDITELGKGFNLIAP